jgi:hypothetical protein
MPPPKMGEHTAALLEELGLADRFEELRGAGVV